MLIRAILFLSFVSIPLSAHALTQADFPAHAHEVLERFFNSGKSAEPGKELKGEKGITLGYRVWEVPKEKGAIVFLPGRGDNYRVFQEAFHEFVNAGYSVYALDERGQGTSDRLLADKQKGYVDRFDYYARDLKTFMDKVVNQKPHTKKFLMSHSMGGGISARYLLKHDRDFDAVVLVAPMLKVNTKPYPYIASELVIGPALEVKSKLKEAESYLKALEMKGKFVKEEDYAPNRGPFDPSEKFSRENELTTCEERFNAYHEIFVRNEALQVGGATIHWVNQVFANSNKIHLEAFKIKTPILLVTAGQDAIVDDDEEAWFCSHVKNCTPFYRPEAKHNIFIETDQNRAPMMAEILQFLGR